MKPLLRELFEKVRSWFHKHTGDTIRAHYELGEMVRDFLLECELNDSITSQYGWQAMKKLALALGREATSTVYSAGKFVRFYTREEMEDLCERVNRDGRPISWSHIHFLLVVEDRDQRNLLLDRALEECWNCLDLAYEVKKLVNGSPERRGRPMAGPRTLPQAVLQQGSFADQFLARNAKVWDGPATSLTAKVGETPPAKITEEIVAGLKATAEKWQKVAQAAQKRAEEAQAAYENCRRKLLANQGPRALPAPDSRGVKKALTFATAPVEAANPNVGKSREGPGTEIEDAAS
jgi:hypothetical protein